ncbi:VPLPA-CTERM sorting domain-containing protein [Rhodovulum visakhapatnamense]|uniref:Putative secreted protein n=1 Tax=Rhodovulum visakhapatnamense TaxID=364297 RepID=A0A4R8G4P4_9RHOB|nr:VPLPA-CTERM sorting domain-containing protein [Rhodovulum visakhapatnamense]TDX30121.1 putative secreted protein [Rhodovulum visakhapatnamense]
MKLNMAFAAISLAVLGSTASAATLNEITDYSSVATNPSVVGSGFDAVTGTLTGGDWDYLALGLPSVGSLIALSFSLADTSIPNGAGFQLYYSYSPFSYTNNSFRQPYNQWVTQTVTPTSVSLQNWSAGTPTNAAFTIDTDPALGSTLFLAIIGTDNTAPSGIGYTVDLPQTSAPAVPLPAGGLLLISALGAAALLCQRQRARKAA